MVSRLFFTWFFQNVIIFHEAPGKTGNVQKSAIHNRTVAPMSAANVRAVGAGSFATASSDASRARDFRKNGKNSVWMAAKAHQIDGLS